MSRKDRPKAQDIFNKTNFVFSEKVPFAEAFPEIESVEVYFKETGYGVISLGPDDDGWMKLSTQPSEFVNCSNGLCYNGGFGLGSIIREMVVNKKTSNEGYKGCRGYEGSPKGRRRYRSCANMFQYKVVIKYR